MKLINFFLNKYNLMGVIPVTIVYSICLYFLKLEEHWILSTAIFFVFNVLLFPVMLKIVDEVIKK